MDFSAALLLVGRIGESERFNDNDNHEIRIWILGQHLSIGYHAFDR